MGERRFTAGLSQSQERAGWSIIFRHPALRNDVSGKPGRRVRRGLRTRDREEADRLCAELNELLADERYWNAAARAEAETRYDSRVVDIFYDKLVAEPTDFAAIRDEAIPLPTVDDDYRRVLFLGTTGAGKTTLVRQFIGTNPVSERFPSTSTAKTTVHDTELVMADGPYRAIVTFTPADEVREYLSECISAAVLAAYRGAKDEEILRRLLSHVNQRFRFNYILGNGPDGGVSEFDEDDDEEAEQELPAVLGDDGRQSDLSATNDLLAHAVEEIRAIAHEHGDALRAELRKDENDERVIDEIFEEELDNLLREDERFHTVADALMDEIENRFDLLTVGIVRRTKQSWPLSWSWDTDDRQAFLRAIARFSSNYAPLFGQLLTPLVNGVRVAGPFAPAWANGNQPKLVLLDGEGLGHIPKSASAISTSVTRRIEQADAVLLVDNAMQPMQAASVAAMRELVSTGNASKLLLAFTHFDEVKGDNLPTATAKAQHVLASAENVLAAIGEELGPFAERALRQRIEKGRFFLAGIHEELETQKKASKRTISQLEALLDAIDHIVERPAPVPVRPVYDRMNLVLAIKSAAESFHDAWWPRLGRAYKPGIPKEHWTRVKALSRRLGEPGWPDEYDTLRPVADLKKELQDRIYVFIQNPVDWNPAGLQPTDEEKQQVFDLLAESISHRILDLATRRMRVERLAEWQDAYNQRGTGSTFVRAEIITDHIYERAAPVPDVTPSPDRNQFLRDVANLVQQAAEEAGATLR